MKFGKYLEGKQRAEWAQHYLNYKKLKDVIKEAQAESVNIGPPGSSPRETSLTVSRVGSTTTTGAGDRFFLILDEEIRKVSTFTQKVVNELRAALKRLDVQSDRKDLTEEQKDALMQEARHFGDEFLALEKFVNLNYLGFHKILKKHDKMLPNNPCQGVFISQLHQQPWVQGNYSDLIVHLSAVYSKLRGDESGVRNEDSAQGFIRSTTKYWVKNVDVSAVKHTVLQHLPVFLFNKEGPDSGDAQLVNSVYLDNTSAELYHGRLDKRSNAIALRLRWYGSGPPTMVFVERKTHRESWKGEESVKERFVLPEDKVVPFLEQEYTVEQAVADLRAKGKSEEEIAKFETLFSECQKVVDSKQLKPMIRTQYMRTAFQIPFDATVRISLDTNLVMIKENPDDGPTCALGHRWYRDPALPISRSEITRFPHAVLEVKLSLAEGQACPEWVSDLLASGWCTEVHKFSKFIHGTCTLMPEVVQAVPYWVDDESVRASMQASAPAKPASQLYYTPPSTNKPRRTPDDDITHPLLGDQPVLQLINNPNAQTPQRDRPVGPTLFDRILGLNKPQARTTAMRLEPKTFFANERTFLSWLHMAVTIGSIAAALLGFAATADRNGKQAGSVASVEIICMILLPLAVVICFYALFVFLWRSQVIAMARTSHIHDRNGPLCLAAMVVFALTAILIISIKSLADTMHHQGQDYTLLMTSFYPWS